MRDGKEIALAAMRKELIRLEKVAQKAKQEADEVAAISSEFLAIHEEFAEIVKSGQTGRDVLKKLDALKVRRTRAEKIMAKDYLKLLDRQSNAELERNALASEISLLEMRMRLQRGAV